MTATLTPAEALGCLADAPATALGPLGHRAALVVDCTPGPALDRLAAASGTVPVVLIGVGDPSAGPPPAAMDVLVTEDPAPPPPWVGRADETGALGDLLAGVAAHPQAATVLCRVLRAGERLGVDDALVVESLAYSALQAGPEFDAWLGSRTGRGAPGIGPVEEGAAHDAPGDGPAVLVERDGSRLRLTLHRPAVHNAVDRRLRDALAEGLALARADRSIEGVELRGAGPSFCSGGDLDEFGTAPDPLTGHLVRTTRSLPAAVHAVAGRTTVYLHGAAVGAGIELAAYAARVVAAPGTAVSLPEVGMGLIPGAGGTASIPRRIGRQRTAFWALSGRRLDAGTARRWGLVDELEG